MQLSYWLELEPNLIDGGQTTAGWAKCFFSITIYLVHHLEAKLDRDIY